MTILCFRKLWPIIARSGVGALPLEKILSHASHVIITLALSEQDVNVVKRLKKMGANKVATHTDEARFSICAQSTVTQPEH